MNFLLIFLGGGLGALSRYCLATGVESLVSSTKLHRFPLGILACNLLGCFCIGLLVGWIATREGGHPSWLHPFAVVGFLGAFTTFSSFAMDNHRLMADAPFHVISNIIISIIGSLIAVWLGFKLAHGASL